MDWANEHWVKLYTRSTPEWNFWPWQSRCVLPLLFREVDKAGQIGLGRHGLDGLATTLRIPLEVLEVGVTALLEDGCVSIVGQTLTVENFVEAQEARTSDKMRQQNLRDRRKSMKTLGVTVTRSNTSSLLEVKRGEESRRETSTPLSAGADAAGQTALSLPESKPPPTLKLTPPGDATPTTVVELWNLEAHPDFGRVVDMKGKRLDILAKVIDQVPRLETWRKAIERLNGWPHAHGQNDTGWKASFDYLLQLNRDRTNLNVVILAEGGKGGAPKASVADVRRGPQRAEDQGWGSVPYAEVKK